MPLVQNFRKNIYLAEDDQDDISLFLETADSLHPGCSVIVSRSGQELLDSLCNAAEDLPEILFLDINMPFKNGLECLKEIRSRKCWDAVKIVMFSTSSSSIHIELACRLGADSYAVKPDSYPRFKELLGSILASDWNGACGNREDFVWQERKAQIDAV